MSLLTPLFNQLSPLGVAAGIPRGVESNYALGFVAGSSQSVNIGNLAIADFGLNNFTVSFWVKGGNSSGGLITKDSIAGGSNGLYIYVGGGGGSYRYFASPNEYIFGTNDGAWHNLCLVRTGTGTGQLELYYDGRLSATGIDARNLNNSRSLLFGCFDGGTGFLTGLLDDVRIYNIALTADQVSQIYNNSIPPPTTGLVGYWNFEEGTGTSTADQSGNGNDGTLVGGPTWQPQVSPRLIRSRNNEDWGVQFDGNNDYIDCGNNSTLNPTSGLTLSAWVKWNAFATEQFAISRDDETDGRSYSIGHNNGFPGKLELQINGAATIRNQGDTMVTGIWYHIAATGDAVSGWKTYINGVQQGSAAWSVPNTTSGSTNIGRRTYTGAEGYFNGQIKDVRIYSSALPLASIQKLSRGVEPSEIPVARWRLNEGTGTIANDSIGTNHGTLTNGPIWTGDIPQWFRQTIESSQALNLDGVDDYVEIASTATLNNAQQTVAFWVSLDDPSDANARVIFSNAPVTEATGWRIATNLSGGKTSFTFRKWTPDTSAELDSGFLFTANAWYFVVVTWDGTNARLYVDGTLRNTRAIASPTAGAAIGRMGADSRGAAFGFLSGNVDDLVIASRVFSAAEAADQAAGYLVTAGLVSRWQLDGNANDSVGSNHGTEQGGVGYSTNVSGTL